MITFIAFLLTILGCINWLLIGMLQYDFIAGLFGFQASMFSRIIYILFGVAAAYLVLRVIVNKGTFKVWERKKKKGQNADLNENVAQNSQNMGHELQNSAQNPQMQPTYSNVEAGQELIPQNNANLQENTQNQVQNSKNKKEKKHWWQFWRRGKKQQKAQPSDGQARHLSAKGAASVNEQNTISNTKQNIFKDKLENSVPEIDVDVSLNAMPPHFNNPPQQKDAPNNLFDEHFN